MLLKLRLRESDRERLGCPEWLEVATDGITNREAVTIREVLGFATPSVLRDRLSATPLVVDGEPVTVDGKQIYDVDPMAWTGLVWLALRRAGIDTDLATLEFAYEVVEVVFPKPAEPVEVPGKAPARRRSTRSAKRS